MKLSSALRRAAVTVGTAVFCCACLGTTAAHATMTLPGSFEVSETGAAAYTIPIAVIGGTYQSSYSYAGTKVHMQGRGFLGFRQVKAKDEQTLVEQLTTYLQSYPFTGLVSARSKKLGAAELNRTENSYDKTDLGSGRSFVFLTQSVEKSWELPPLGTALPILTTTYQYDSFGNATQVIVSTADGYSKTTTNTYTNDATNWILGRLTRAAVTSDTPN